MSDKPVAWLDGWFAHKRGTPVSGNPFSENTQSVSRGRWLYGWTARFAACKHDLSLEHDNYEDEY
jgi:hypothetical protein